MGYPWQDHGESQVELDHSQEHLNLYLNFHRPCFFPEICTNPKDKERKDYRYKMMMTPYEKLKTLQQTEANHLKPGITFEILDATAYQLSENQAADRRSRRPASNYSPRSMTELNTLTD